MRRPGRPPGPLGRLRGGALTSVLALAAGVLAPVAAAPPAAALTAPVAFTADHLPTYQTNGIVWTLAEADGVVYAGGTFSAVRPAGSGGGSTPAVNFAAFNAATGAPAGCSLSFTRTSGTATVRALAVSPDKSTLYVGGYFNAVNGTSANGLVAVDTATCTRRAGSSPSFSATVRALDVAANGTVYAGGDFQSVNGQTRRFFGALTPAGAVTGWNPDADDPGRTLKVTPDDGVRVASNTTAGNRSYNGYWRVGGDAMNNAWPNRPSSTYFAGQVDETAIYPSALTADRVAAHHQLAQAPAPPGDTTVSLLPTEDAYVNSVAANTNYNDQQLASRGTTAYLSCLRFALPAAPAGQVLKGARLTFRTSSDATAGSTDSHTVVPVTGARTESAVTYNTRPALAASVLGTITGATAVSTDYSVELTAPALGGALGSACSLALTSSGTDSLRVWSSEAGSAASRPQLVLTFGAE
ncbi:DNRLRE domain-containing protein [Kitasatospora albolonga]